MVWKIDNPQGAESFKIKYDIVPYTRGRGLDLGCGMYKAYPHFIGVDNRKQWGTKLSAYDEYALRLSLDVTCDCSDLSLFTSNSMDFVFSSHLLEHLEEPERVLKNWWRVIKPGGYLILYLPHADFYPKIGTEGANPDHVSDFYPNDIIAHMRSVGGWDLLVNEERNHDQEYSFLQVYLKRSDKVTNLAPSRIKHEKTCCVQRYGGFGDQIQASSILPWLKKEGYFITFMTTPRGYNILKHDPHIDDWIIQDDDQVPMEELHDYWDVWAKKFDRFICLTESVEANLLIMQYRVPHRWWPSAARNLLCDVNYLEMTHVIADVPEPYQPAFYPSAKETRRAVKIADNFSGPFIMWALAGSSVHKHWPLTHNAMARILTETNYSIVLVGAGMDALIEDGWQNEPRVIKTVDKWSIRQTLSFIPYCDMVIGPETGVLNAAGMLPMPKIVFLSHSSVENFSKHFINIYSLTPDPSDCPCYPCHKMIHGWESCVRDDTGALCQTQISLDKFWQAFLFAENTIKYKKAV